MADCPTVILNLGGSGTLTFDCETTIAGTVWIWTELTGWWEPPAPIRASIPGPGASGQLLAEKPTAARWGPRDMVLTVQAVTNGSEGQLVDSLNTIAALATPLTIGSLVVVDDEPKACAVRLTAGQRVSTEVLGEMKAMKATIPLTSYDPLRTRLADGVRVL